MRNSFKNFRRDHPVDECSPRRARENDQGPPSKRLKTVLTDDDDNMIQDDDEYEEVVRDLKHEWKKGKKSRSKAKINRLMSRTSMKRRQWIIESRPLVSEVLGNFPCLAQSKTVSNIA